jgi:hypothetical protein
MMTSSLRASLQTASAMALVAVASLSGARAAALPENIGGDLTALVADHMAGTHEQDRLAAMSVRDKAGRYMVEIFVAKGASYNAVREAAIAAGATIETDIKWFHSGVMSAWMPIDSVPRVATANGVRSLSLVHKPRFNVGLVTTQGASVLQSLQLNQMHLQGFGITIGALSNSYNTYTAYPASTDVSTGDLPGKTDPDGASPDVVLLKEGPAGDDEGRGILQILHDMAPKAKLCFATAYSSPEAFAKHIIDLANPAGKCRADIIDDDVGYSNEPDFSDEDVISAAVNQVVSQGVIYTSSAGNGNQGSYNATFNPIPPATALGLPGQTVNLSQVPAKLLAGGVHNFGTADTPVISQSVTTDSEAGLTEDLAILQWNDPFNFDMMTANYVVLIFDSAGNYLATDSGVGDAIKHDQPIQVGQLPVHTAATNYQIVIAKTTTASSPATQIRWTSFEQALTRQNDFNADHSPSMNGHAATDGAIGVAADYWGATAGTEYFSSQGPFTNYFDSSGNRLGTPEVRQKPEIATVDGVNTTFFPPGGASIEENGFPDFFGTSAAGPHAAGVAALLLEKAGGKGSITPAAMKTLLEASTAPHSLSPGFVTATLSGGKGYGVTVSAHGYVPIDPTQWSVTVNTKSGVSLTQLVFNGFNSHIAFSNPFYFGSSNNVTASQVTTDAGNILSYGFTLDVTPGAAVNGTTFTYSVDFDNSVAGYLGIDSTLLSGVTVSAKFSDGTITTGQPLEPTSFGAGYSWDDGFGLINAVTAASMVTPGAKTHR